MIPTDPTILLIVSCWAMAAVGVGIVCGFFIGRWYAFANEPKKLKLDRDRTIKSLMALLASTDQLNEDVDHHTSALREARKDLAEIPEDTSQVTEVQAKLLENIASMVRSNRKLENDLTVSRYKLQKQAEELDKSKKEARTDVLCSLGNRKAFGEALQFMLSRHRVKGTQFGLMLVDVDHFKRINDTFGHASGDRVLVSIGDALSQCVRPDDIVCRIGGDEFGILLDNTNQDEVELVGKRIRSTIELFNFEVGDADESTVVTLSMGLTVVQDGDSDLTLFERADQALYRSKSLGRNRLSTDTSQEGDADNSTQGAPIPMQTYEEIKASYHNDQLL